MKTLIALLISLLLFGCGEPIMLTINEVSQDELNDICDHVEGGNANGCCFYVDAPGTEYWTVFILDYPESDLYGKNTLILGHEIGDCLTKREGIHVYNEGQKSDQ